MNSLKILVMVWHLEMGVSQVYEEETRSPFLQLLVCRVGLVSLQVDLVCIVAAGYCEITPLHLGCMVFSKLTVNTFHVISY